MSAREGKGRERRRAKMARATRKTSDAEEKKIDHPLAETEEEGGRGKGGQ